MATITKASAQWASRPADQRFTSLPSLAGYLDHVRANSSAKVVSSKKLEVVPVGYDHKRLAITGPNGHAYEPTHFSFGQLSSLVKAPAGYLRNLPAELAADNLNWGLRVARDVEEVGCLISQPSVYHVPSEPDIMLPAELRAATGPNYGRIWNSEIANLLVDRFGDGVSGDWRVPGEFGKAVTVDKANTTLYGSDRDIFVFLADENNRVEIANRRDGKPGSLARGFFMWNSEVGATTLGVAFFLFDYVCCNRIVWGATQYQEIRVRHTSGAPDRWLDEVVPVLNEYSESSAKPVQQAIEDARAKRIDQDVTEFLTKRFGKGIAEKAQAVHVTEEGRPIETVWDAVTGVTAHARSIQFQDARVDLERQAGDLLKAA